MEKENQNISMIALLTALACVLQIVESAIPHPVPGLRLGLANTITLVALVNLGFGQALEIAVFRTILSSFLMGTFLSPSFIMSFGGALVSTLVMGFCYWLSGRLRHYRFSYIGVSVIGALTHNLVQLYLAYLILIHHKGIFVFLPYLCLGAVVTGWLTGLLAANVCRGLKEGRQEKYQVQGATPNVPLTTGYYSPGISLIHRLPATLKISFVFFLALLVLVSKNSWLYALIFLSLLGIVRLAQIPLFTFTGRLRKYSSLFLTAFLMPVFFNHGRHVLVQLANVKISTEGLNSGAIFAARIIFLVMANVILMNTTSIKEMTRGLSKMLSPLRILGISEKRVATILSLSMVAIPFLLAMAKKVFQEWQLEKKKTLQKSIPLFSDFIVNLYLETERYGMTGSEIQWWQAVPEGTAGKGGGEQGKRQGKERTSILPAGS